MPLNAAPAPSPAARACTECGAPLRSKKYPKSHLCRVCNAKHWVQVEWESESGIRIPAA